MKTFNDTKDDLDYQTKRLADPEAEHRPDRGAADEPAGAAALGRGARSTAAWAIARSNLGQLNIRAPVTGQLSGFDIQLGQSLQQGERIGQIDSAGGNKLQADVDEYLSRPRRASGRPRPPTSTARPTG